MKTGGVNTHSFVSCIPCFSFPLWALWALSRGTVWLFSGRELCRLLGLCRGGEVLIDVAVS